MKPKYSLSIHGFHALKMLSSKNNFHLYLLKRLPIAGFKAREACAKWNIFHRNTNRVLAELLAQGRLEKIGRGKSVRYRETEVI